MNGRESGRKMKIVWITKKDNNLTCEEVKFEAFREAITNVPVRIVSTARFASV